MMKKNRDALICDLAETYQVYDMKAFPVSFISTLAAGLGRETRIQMEMRGEKLNDTVSLLALIFDRVNMFCYSQSKDALHHRNAPKSVYAILTGGYNKPKDAVEGFTSPDEFEKRRKEILGG